MAQSLKASTIIIPCKNDTALSHGPLNLEGCDSAAAALNCS